MAESTQIEIYPAEQQLRKSGVISGRQRVADAIGRKFVFGVGEHVIAGTITSVGYAPNPEGVSLRVSAPKICGKFIVKIKPTEAGYGLIVCTDDTTLSGGFIVL